jgi:predicted phosphodiesterase
VPTLQEKSRLKKYKTKDGRVKSPLDFNPFYCFILDKIERGVNNYEIARLITKEFGVFTTEASIRKFKKRRISEQYDEVIKANAKVSDKAGVIQKDDNLMVTSDFIDEWVTPEEMLLRVGVDPQTVAITHVSPNQWEGPDPDGGIRLFRQLKVAAQVINPELQIRAARSDGWVAPKPRPSNKGEQLIVVAGDQQAPYHDEGLHEAFCSFLDENQPERIVLLGDTGDYPSISRHRKDPENIATVNECTQAVYNILRDIRVAASNAQIDILAGNHDQQRLRDILIDKIPDLYNVKRADTDEIQDEEVLIFPYLVRLDELKINYVDPEGPYDLAQINLTPKLAVKHGWIARQGSGVSALATLEHLGFSVIVGHTHRQSLVYHTKHDINGEPSTLVGAEAGCMCRVDQSPTKGRKYPNYTVAPNWQQGFCTVTTHPNGFFRIDHGTYVNGVLLWRDRIYQ